MLNKNTNFGYGWIISLTAIQMIKFYHIEAEILVRLEFYYLHQLVLATINNDGTAIHFVLNTPC